MKRDHGFWTRAMKYLALAAVAVLLVPALLPKRWLYRHGRPNRLARLLNRGWAIVHAAGLWPSRLVTLEVRGRRTGRVISLPLAIADYQGERYLVAMLGENSNWVRNVRTAGGRVVLRHGRRETVRLKRSILPLGRRSCADTCRWHPGLGPTYRSIATPPWKTSSGSRRRLLPFA